MRALAIVAITMFLAACGSPEGSTTSSADTNLLLKVINRGYYSTVIPGQYWDDASPYMRFVVHRDVPADYDALGGITFNGTTSFVAVNDGFMEGLYGFEISFWFSPAVDQPPAATLAASNWATPNNGDWLLNIDDNGALSFLMQTPQSTILVAGQPKAFTHGVKHFVKIRKVGITLVVLLNNVEELRATVPAGWAENGSPLAFGANAYDRLSGLGYFAGSMGDIQITEIKE